MRHGPNRLRRVVALLFGAVVLSTACDADRGQHRTEPPAPASAVAVSSTTGPSISIAPAPESSQPLVDPEHTDDAVGPAADTDPLSGSADETSSIDSTTQQPDIASDMRDEAVPPVSVDPVRDPEEDEGEEPSEPGVRPCVAGDPPSLPFRGLVYASAGRAISVEAIGAHRQDAQMSELWEDMETVISREGVEIPEYEVGHFLPLRMVYLNSANSDNSELCIVAPIGAFPCVSWLTGQSDGALFAESNGSFKPIAAFAPWGQHLELLTETDDSFEDRFYRGGLWPVGHYDKSMPYGDGTFELTRLDRGFALQNGDIRREYALFPWGAERGPDGTYDLNEVPPLTDRLLNDEGLPVIPGSIFLAGTDGERIAVVYEPSEPACGDSEYVYLISLRDGAVQSCIHDGSRGGFALVATSESYEPLLDVKLPPSGWLHTEPCTIVSPYIVGAEFGRDDSDWAAFAKLVLLPNSAPK